MVSSCLQQNYKLCLDYFLKQNLVVIFNVISLESFFGEVKYALDL